MSIFNFKKSNQEYLFPPEETEKLEDLLKTSVIMPRSNDDVEFVVPLFNTRKHYKHLKKMMWKHHHI